MQFRSSTAFGMAALALSAGTIAACATSSTTYSDDDAGVMMIDTGPTDGGASPAKDAGTKPTPKDSGTSNNDDSGVVVNPEGGTCVKDPPSNMCGVAPQCGCGLGETCDVTDNAGNVTCITAGTGTQGKACTGTAGCALGLTCLGGACRPFCPAGTASNGACGLAGTNICFYVPDNNKTPIPNLHICQITCDLTSPTACDSPSAPAGIIGCDVDGTGNTDCLPAGTLTDKDATQCDATHMCAPGYVCATITQGTTTSNLCKHWCKVGDNTVCGGKTCGGFNPKVTVGAVEYGACP